MKPSQPNSLRGEHPNNLMPEKMLARYRIGARNTHNTTVTIPPAVFCTGNRGNYLFFELRQAIYRYTNEYSVIMLMWAFIYFLDHRRYCINTKSPKETVLWVVNIELATAPKLLYDISRAVVVAGTAAFLPPRTEPRFNQYSIPAMSLLNFCPGRNGINTTSTGGLSLHG